MLGAGSLSGDPVPVRFAEGPAHGFLTVHDDNGKTIGAGEYIETAAAKAQGGRVTVRLTLHFDDGSLDDETSVFTQHGTFRLVSDRHIQSGRSYQHPLDMNVDAPSGVVTVRSVDKGGQSKATTSHLDLPADISNGLIFVLLKDLPAAAPAATVSMVVATPKPRLVKLKIADEGDEPFSVGSIHLKAAHYVVKIDLGGIAGIVAPMIGKQPGDVHVWVLGGVAPVILKEQGPLAEDGPVWTIELATPVWPGAAAH